jgi:hypothetical protein
MVVESSLAIQKLIEFSLGKEGFEVASFSDGSRLMLSKVSRLSCADYNPPGISIRRSSELKKQLSFYDRPSVDH